MFLESNKFEDLFDQSVLLFSNVHVEGRVSDMALDCTLHHRASIIVLDIAFPARLRQVRILREALLTEVLDGIVISVSQEIVQLFRLSMILEFVH